jgi:hypothetical protein
MPDETEHHAVRSLGLKATDDGVVTVYFRSVRREVDRAALSKEVLGSRTQVAVGQCKLQRGSLIRIDCQDGCRQVFRPPRLGHRELECKFGMVEASIGKIAIARI